MHKAFKFRIYPTKEQETLIHKTFGCCRFVFNPFLEKWNEEYDKTGKGLNYSTCAKQLTQLNEEGIGMVKRSGLHFTAKCIKTSG